MAAGVRAWLVWLSVLILLLPAAAWSAPKDKNKQDDAKRRRIDDLERQIRAGEQQLHQLKQQESQLNKEVQQLERELPGAKDKLKKAEGELKEADRASDAVRDDLAKHRDAIKSATQSLAEVAERIEKSQPSNTPFGQARAAYLAAKSSYQAKIDEISNSAEYKQAYAEAVASNNRAVLMPAIKKKYLDDNPEVLSLREQLTQAKAAYEKLQQELFARMPEYGRAAQTLDRAKDEEDKAEKGLRDATGKLTAAKRTLAVQQAAVNNMEGALHRDKDTLKKIPGLRDKVAHELERDRRERQQIR